MAAPPPAPSDGGGFFGFFTAEPQKPSTSEDQHGSAAPQKPARRITGSDVLAPEPEDVAMWDEPRGSSSSMDAFDDRTTISPVPGRNTEASSPQGARASGAPVKRNRRKESVSALIKKSYTDDDTNASKSQLEDRLKELNDGVEEAAAQEEAKLKAAHIIDHESVGYIAWSALMTALAFYSNFINAYQIAFWWQLDEFSPVLIAEYVLDVAFVADLASGFFVSYYQDDVKILNRRLIMRKFVRSPRFVFDAVACLPLDVLQLAVGWNPLCRVNKLCRLYSLVHHTGFLERQTPNPSLRNTMRVARLVLVWLQVPHLLACVRLLLVLLEDLPCETGEWKPLPEVMVADVWTQCMRCHASPAASALPHHPCRSLHRVHLCARARAADLHSLYWCMGVMTGFGDGNTPETVPQYLFTLFVINLGLFTFAYTVGVLGAIGSQKAQRANDFQVIMHAIRAFTSNYALSEALQERISLYLRHRWDNLMTGQRELVDAAELLEQLPSTMRFEAVECMTMETLAKVPLFARVEEGFMHALTQKMQAVNCSIGEVLLRQDDINEVFYIVLNGRLQVQQDGQRLDDLSAGSFFGEGTMLSKAPAKSTITSLSFCELYKLGKNDLQTLRINFPETFTGFEQAAKLEAKNADRAARNKKNFAASAVAEPKRARFLIEPATRARALWALLLYVALIYDVFMFPVKLVFVGNQIHASLMAFDVLFDLLLLVDCFLHFRLCFYIDGRLITDVREIRWRYLYGEHSNMRIQQQAFRGNWKQRTRRALLFGAFAPTFLSAFPCCLLAVFWPLADARSLQTARLVRLVRLLPIIRGDNVFRQQPNGLDELMRVVRRHSFDLQYTAQQLLPLLAAYALLAHYVACGYWAVVMTAVPPHVIDVGIMYVPTDSTHYGDLSSLNVSHAGAGGVLGPWLDDARVVELVGDGEWIPTLPYLQHGNVLLWYLRALYFAVVNLTGLGKSPTPLQNLSLVYTTCTFIVGVLVFAYITSAIVTIVMNANAPFVRFDERKTRLLGFMGDAHVSQPLRQRATRWMEHWWFAHGGTPAGFVVDQLPPSLREEVRFRVFQGATQNSKVFLPLWEQRKLNKGPKPPKGKKGAPAEAPLTEEEVHEKKQATLRETIARELVLAIEFEVYNPGEWVLHKGMLNEVFYIVTVGVAQVLLVEPDDGSDGGGRPSRGGRSYEHLCGKCIAELGVGDIFGEISSMYRNKCEASVRAKTPLEVIAIPRATMMRALHRSNPLMQRILGVIRKRRKENDFFKLGRTDLGNMALARMAAHKLGNWIKKRMAAKAARAAEAAEAALHA